MSCVATADRGPVLVLGLGNPILGDDGVGWHVIDALERRLARDTAVGERIGQFELERLAVGGLVLMERMVGYRCAVLVDALLVGGPPGTLSVGPLNEVGCREAGHLDSAHDVPLTLALSAGRALGAQLPSDVMVVGIAVDVIDQFGDSLSPAVAAAVEPAVDAVIGILARQPASVG